MSSRRKPTASAPAPAPAPAPASLSADSPSSPVLVASSAAALAPAAASQKQRHETSAAASSPTSPSSSSPAARPPSRARVLPLWFCFGVILAARVASALLSPIADCDEVFNYWEPVHYLLFGSGLQTWEYSPAFALRSYLYLVLHAAPLRALYALLAGAPALLPSVLLPSASLAAHVNGVQAFGVPTKVLLFYALRLLLGTAAAFAEARFVVAATRALHRTLGTCARHAGAFLLLFTAFGPGQFIAAAAMLPQSFVLVCLQFAFAAWLEASTAAEAQVAAASSSSSASSAAAAPSARILSWPLGGYSSVIWWAVAAALVGCWPFVLIVVLPMALHTLFAFGWWRSVASGALAVGVTLGASLAVDRHYYGRWTLAVFNLAEYNARSQHGPTLYGVEPASYYVKNLALNWNVVFAFGAAGPVFAALLVACTPGKRAAALAFLRWVAGGLLWAGVMFAQPHKEERFLYPIYHLLILSAVYCICEFPALLCGQVATEPFGAVSVSNGSGRGRTGSSSLVKWAGRASRLALVLVFVALSVSRNIAMVVNYAAPLRVWRALAAEQTALTLRASEAATAAAAASSFSVDAEAAAPRLVNSTTVCVGKEWYRFASSFFVPHAQLLFLRSGFTGQLPQPFAPVDAATGRSGTSVELPHFNDENREEASRYAPVEACDFIVDLDLVGQVEERFYNHPDFLLVHSEKFLDATRSPQLTRAFWIPYLSQQRNIFRPYQLFRRKSLDEL